MIAQAEHGGDICTEILNSFRTTQIAEEGKKRNSSEILVSRTYSMDPEFLMNAENILPVVMPVRCQEHLFEDTQAARHSKSRVFEDKYSTGKKKSTNFS